MNAPSTATASLRLPPWPVVVAVLAIGGLLVAFPPFRIVSRNAAAMSAPEAFDAAAFVGTFWIERLLPASAVAPEVGPILADVRRDPVGARTSHARRVGLGSAAYYFARVSGRIAAVERSRLIVEVDGAEGVTVAVRTGPVFGNAVRDGCGLLEVNDAPGLAEFNALSAELNRIVESRVLPAMRDRAAVGGRIVFAGCAEAPESNPGDGPLLTFIPVHAEVTP
jgi:predicted lipoprotein